MQVKKRHYWPKFIHGDEIHTHFDEKDVGTADLWPGQLDNVPFHVYTMKSLTM